MIKERLRFRKSQIQKEISEINVRINRIDSILDSDGGLDNSIWESLEAEQRRLYAKLGKLENILKYFSVDELEGLNEWTTKFLSTFSVGTRLITNRQAEVFKKINHGKPFIYNGIFYDFAMGRKFSHVFVVNLDVL